MSHLCTSASSLGLQSTPNLHFLSTYSNSSTTFCYENGQVPTCLGLLTRLGLPDCYDTPGMFWIDMDWFLQQYGLDCSRPSLLFTVRIMSGSDLRWALCSSSFRFATDCYGGLDLL